MGCRRKGRIMVRQESNDVAARVGGSAFGSWPEFWIVCHVLKDFFTNLLQATKHEGW